MCVGCLRARVDITEGIPKQLTLSFCKQCERWAPAPRPPEAAPLRGKANQQGSGGLPAPGAVTRCGVFSSSLVQLGGDLLVACTGLEVVLQLQG